MSQIIHTFCDLCETEMHDKAKRTPFVVSLAQPGSYCYGRPDSEHPLMFNFRDVCAHCLDRLDKAIQREVKSIRTP